jgi:hypothetical protein
MKPAEVAVQPIAIGSGTGVSIVTTVSTTEPAALDARFEVLQTALAGA